MSFFNVPIIVLLFRDDGHTLRNSSFISRFSFRSLNICCSLRINSAGIPTSWTRVEWMNACPMENLVYIPSTEWQCFLLVHYRSMCPKWDDASAILYRIAWTRLYSVHISITIAKTSKCNFNEWSDRFVYSPHLWFWIRFLLRNTSYA